MNVTVSSASRLYHWYARERLTTANASTPLRGKEAVCNVGALGNGKRNVTLSCLCIVDGTGTLVMTTV